jgi:hypothetical protein
MKYKKTLNVFLDVLDHSCAICKTYIADMYTKKGRLRLVCRNCYDAILVHMFKSGKKGSRDERPGVWIAAYVKLRKIEKGIIPANAWEFKGLPK